MKWKAALALALLAPTLAPGPAGAETFLVDTEMDGFVACGPLSPSCTLRGAFLAAMQNGNDEDDLIVVPEGDYALVEVGIALNAATRITVRGAGANATTIRPVGSLRPLTLTGGSQLTVEDLTLRDGNAGSGDGGNVQVQSSDLTLRRVRVTGGKATRGGGIHISAGSEASLTISQSLIDGNTATGGGENDMGGGIFIQGQTSSAAVTISDSTLTGNEAGSGGAVGVVFNAGQTPSLRGVTVARNTAHSASGIAGISTPGRIRFQGSIIADNVTLFDGGGTETTNCSLELGPIDDGGNLESHTTCGFTTSAQNVDPKLAAGLDASSPPALAIAADSPARDIADCGGRTVDQRGVARPQGPRCDAGAYEYREPDPDPVPPPPPPTATPTPTPTPTPAFRSTVVTREVSGRIRIRRRGSSRFVNLDASQAIPLGSTVDARRGRVEIAAISRRGGPVERAIFYAGMFRITQSGGLTTLTLNERLARCPKTRAKRASAAAKRPKKRRLWGNGKGRFRTKGRYAAATVRGTKWLVQDSCAGTLTRVTQGSVTVRDRVRKKTVIVKKGKRYLARPKR